MFLINLFFNKRKYILIFCVLNLVILDIFCWNILNIKSIYDLVYIIYYGKLVCKFVDLNLFSVILMCFFL